MSESPKQIPPFGLRMPPDLKERIQAAAIENNRSMNAEIVSRLEASLVPGESLVSKLDDERLEKVVHAVLVRSGVIPED
ncbi:MAG: Arc family DNA-binding protein [Pseudomonadota bacterium]|nr:Arc family DNA-binding protein [Pseudomonadota bacterium]